jgi:Cft2 family RNA processing exonuclease
MSELECLPLGIGQDGEGVCLDLRLGHYHFLLDCGLKNLSTLETLAKHQTWTGLFCSHAHADHCRGIAKLQAIAPSIPIFTTEVTAHLLQLACKQTSPLLRSIVPLDGGETVEIAPNLSIKLLPSGHLPGAASIWLTYTGGDRNYNVLYTGDFLISNSRLVQGLRLDQFRGSNLDVLIIEGSFGTIKHPHRRHQEHTLVQQIQQAIARGYSIVFPVPKVGIGQEILMLLRSHHAFTGKDLDIWVDAGVGVGCDLYMELLTYLPTSVQNFSQHQSLFWDDRISPRIQSIELIQKSQLPAIIFVDQDTDWLYNSSLEVNPYLVFIPVQKTELITELTDQDIPFSTYLLAEHCDISGTTQLIHNLKPQHIVFMHGDSSYLADLANLEELSNRYHIHCPEIGIPLDLPVGESFHIPHQRQNQFSPYSGELAELNSAIMLTLPVEVTSDHRWFNFADTGLIEARWQGEDLLIRGISQRELLNGQSEEQGIPSCNICRFYSGQRCLNRESPLSGLKVSADGCCMGFEKIPEEL